MNWLTSRIENGSQSLKDCIVMKRYEKGMTILSAEDEIKGVLIVKKGKAKVYSLAENGSTHMIKIYEAGELLGEMEILTGRTVFHYVEALETCEMMWISQSLFFDWIKEDSDVSLYIMKQLAEKLYRSATVMKSVVLYPLKYQVLFFIWRHICETKEMVIKKELVVEALGSNTRSINRIIKELDEDGILDNLSGEIIVHEFSKVVQLVSQYES